LSDARDAGEKDAARHVAEVDVFQGGKVAGEQAEARHLQEAEGLRGQVERESS